MSFIQPTPLWYSVLITPLICTEYITSQQVLSDDGFLHIFARRGQESLWSFSAGIRDPSIAKKCACNSAADAANPAPRLQITAHLELIATTLDHVSLLQ